VLVDLMFDAQTSGGMVLGVPHGMVKDVRDWLCERGELAAVIGSVEATRLDGKRLILC
jgi:selenide,water dikinase